MKRAALVISHLLDPIIVLTLVTSVGVVLSDLKSWQLGKFLLVLFFGIFLPPVVLRIWAVQHNVIKNWDITDRRQRPKTFGILLLLGVINLLLVKIYGNTFLFDLFTLYLIWLVGFAIITYFWKISGHSGAITLAVGFMITWFGWSWWPVCVLIPLVGWARVTARAHTRNQVIFGTLYSLAILLLYRLIFNLKFEI